jgi:hypothetical protein
LGRPRTPKLVARAKIKHLTISFDTRTCGYVIFFSLPCALDL